MTVSLERLEREQDKLAAQVQALLQLGRELTNVQRLARSTATESARQAVSDAASALTMVQDRYDTAIGAARRLERRNA